MQKIGFENNLAETAFLMEKKGANQLCWFTPEIEIDLCGHATLATAFVLIHLIRPSQTAIQFKTKNGGLNVHRDGELYTMDFPAHMPKPVEKADNCQTDFQTGWDAALRVLRRAGKNRRYSSLLSERGITAVALPEGGLYRFFSLFS